MSKICPNMILCLLAFFLSGSANGQTTTANEKQERAALEKTLETKKWTYGDLNRSADAVLIGTVMSQENGKPEMFSGDWQDVGGQTAVEVVVSTFVIATVLKGDLRQKSVEVVHLRKVKGIIDASPVRVPEFAREKSVPKYVVAEVDGKETFSGPFEVRTIVPEYLLFLKRRQDGKYQLAGGDVDGDASVRLLNLTK